MNKSPYKKLIINTLLFALGQFGPSILSVFMVPIYTNCMSRAEFGTADLVINMACMLIPFVSVCITDGIVKFSLDGKHNIKQVFSISFFVCLIGSVLSFAAYPLIYKYGQVSEYMLFFYMILITSVFSNLLLLYIKALQKLTGYTVIALVKTTTMLIGNIVTLRVLNMGVRGFLWSYVISNVAGCIMAVIYGNLIRLIRIKYVDKKTSKEMILFSLPLIPNQASISLMGSMDRYMLTYMLDSSYNGLYSIAHKLPSLVERFSSVFNQAWNYSALENQTQKDQKEYYQSIYKIYGCYMFVLASMVMCVLRPVMYVWVGPEFREAWLYAPYLLLGAVFSCFTGFYVPLFVITEKTGTLFVSTLTGAVINLTLNSLLIPVWGINGASFASAVTYLVVWLIRGIMISKYVDIHFDNKMACINAAILFVQGTCLLIPESSSSWIQFLFCGLLFVINRKDIISFIKRITSIIIRKAGKNKT